MADSTLRLTYSDLRTRVAEYLGLASYGVDGDQAAQLPTDAHDLDLVGRLVNDGYRRFIGDNESWNFMVVPLSIVFGTGTVSGDTARYYLPDDFQGDLLTPFTYGSNGPLRRIVAVPEYRIRELQAGGQVAGDPSLVAVRAINTTAASNGQRWEAIFYPTPTGTQTVTATYRRFPAALSSATDVSVGGFQHDRTVLASAIAEAEREKNDQAGVREAAYQEALMRSKRVDAKVGTMRIADYGDRSEDGSYGRRPLSYYRVDTYNGNPVN